jgi:hypothetical protein
MRKGTMPLDRLLLPITWLIGYRLFSPLLPCTLVAALAEGLG